MKKFSLFLIVFVFTVFANKKMVIGYFDAVKFAQNSASIYGNEEATRKKIMESKGYKKHMTAAGYQEQINELNAILDSLKRNNLEKDIAMIQDSINKLWIIYDDFVEKQMNKESINKDFRDDNQEMLIRSQEIWEYLLKKHKLDAIMVEIEGTTNIQFSKPDFDANNLDKYKIKKIDLTDDLIKAHNTKFTK